MSNLTIITNTRECNSNPLVVGQPLALDTIRPSLRVMSFTVVNRNGDAIRRNSNPEMIEMIHLSLDVTAFEQSSLDMFT